MSISLSQQAAINEQPSVEWLLSRQVAGPNLSQTSDERNGRLVRKVLQKNPRKCGFSGDFENVVTSY